MRKIILYLAMSLDGFLADAEGGVGWLGGEDPAYEGDYGYGAFYQTVDTLVMGWRTYRQVTTQLSPGAWPYAGKTSYVLTHRRLPDTREIRFTAGPPLALLERLRREDGGGVWICGGAEVVRQALPLVDELHLSVMPRLLGGGIRLFPEGEAVPLHLASVRQENGVLLCVYTK